MNPDRLHEELAPVLAARRLLEHRFYRRWTEGTVGRDELAGYAAQYRHFERLLPSLLRRVADEATDDALRESALRNLADECGEPSHLALFEEFAAAVGAPAEAEPSEAMQRLLVIYGRASSAGPVEAFAALFAYEAQAPEVSAEKARGLERHHGIAGAGIRFWQEHATLDRDHARWALAGLAASIERPEAVRPWVATAAEGWWHFLDEREALSRR